MNTIQYFSILKRSLLGFSILTTSAYNDCHALTPTISNINQVNDYTNLRDNDVDNPNHFASGSQAIGLTGNGVNVPLHDNNAENVLDGSFLRWSNSLTHFKLKTKENTTNNSEINQAITINSVNQEVEQIPAKPLILQNNESNKDNKDLSFQEISKQDNNKNQITANKNPDNKTVNIQNNEKTAEEQLLLRNLLSQSKKIRTEFAMNYGTQTNNTLLQDDTTNKNYIAEETQQTLQPTATIRYGINENLEIYSRLTANWSKKSTAFKFDDTYFNDNESTNNSLKLQNLRLGMNYRLWNNDDSGVLGLFETSILDRNTGFLADGTEKKYSSFASQIYGVTAYRSLEPLVLSVTGIYGANRKRLSQNQYNIGNYWLLQPSLAFNPNDNMTLSFGPQWLKIQATTLNNELVAPENTSIDWTWNFAWAIDSKNTLNFSGNSGQYQQIQTINGSNRNINISWLKQWN